MTRDPATENLVDSLADEFMRRYRAGERPTIAEYLTRCPDVADEIRNLFPALIMLEDLATPHEQRPQYSLLAGLKRPDVLGDYRILQETGRGGMGIVYEAEQISLGRHVALKILPFQLVSDESAVERFHREARAAARLQHPNIVPVYDFCQGESVWYYAMQFIHGQSLQEILSELQRLRDDADESQTRGQLLGLATSLLSDDTWDYEQAENLEDSSLDESPQQDRIREVLDDTLQRLARGETVSEQDLFRQHADLMPELEEQFRMLQLIEASRPPLMVDELEQLEHRLQSNVETPAPRPSSTPAGPPQQPTSAQKLTGVHHAEAKPKFHEYFKNTARLMMQVGRALEYAHQEGVIHRDVKPSNLLLDTRGQIWITDFGLAKLSRGDVTSTGSFAGTLRYMAPEQIRGQCDARTDVYSLGITLYEMLTLRPAFQGVDYLGMMKQICEEGPRPPRQIEPTIPRDLETVVLRAIERDPDARYESAKALANDLERFIDHREIRAKRTRSLKRNVHTVIRRPMVLGGLVVVALALLLWVFLPRPSTSDPAVPASSGYIIALLQAQIEIEKQRYENAQTLLKPYSDRQTFELGILRRRCRPDLKVFDQLQVATGPVLQLAIAGDHIAAIADGVPVLIDRHNRQLQRGSEAWADQVFRGPAGPGWFGTQAGRLVWSDGVDKLPQICPFADHQHPVVRAAISPDGRWICLSDELERMQLWKFNQDTAGFDAVEAALPKSHEFHFARLRPADPPQLILKTGQGVTVACLEPAVNRTDFPSSSVHYGLILDEAELLAAEGGQIHWVDRLSRNSESVKLLGGRVTTALHATRNGETTLAGLSDGSIGLWDRHTQKKMLNLEEATEAICALDSSASEDLLVAGGQEGTIYWWDASTPQ